MLLPLNKPVCQHSLLSVSILAGGKSSRMGQDKGLMLLGKKPMIQYLLDTFKHFNLPLQIIAHDLNYHSLAYSVHEDLYKNKGPMGGLYTALKSSSSPHVLLISCDSPFISATAIEKLISCMDGDKIIVSKIYDKLNPLFAIYPTSLLEDVLNHILDGKLRITDFVLDCPHLIISMDTFTQNDPIEFYNINSPTDVIHCKSKWE